MDLKYKKMGYKREKKKNKIMKKNGSKRRKRINEITLKNEYERIIIINN